MMIPIEVENRIAKYFFHVYLPEDIMMEIESRLLEICEKYDYDDEPDHDELVLLAVNILIDSLDGKSFK